MLKFPDFSESPYSERNVPWVFVVIGILGAYIVGWAAGALIGWW